MDNKFEIQYDFTGSKMQITFKQSIRKVFGFFLPRHLQNHFYVYINHKSVHISLTTSFKISWFFSKQSCLELYSLTMASTNLFLFTFSSLALPECLMSSTESIKERMSFFPAFHDGAWPKWDSTWQVDHSPLKPPSAEPYKETQTLFPDPLQSYIHWMCI